MKDFAVCICSSRPAGLEFLLESIAQQSIAPKQLIIVATFPEKVVAASLKKHANSIFLFTQKKSIAHSRSLALQKITSDTFFFIDDDVVISKKTFFVEMLKERTERNCAALAPQVLPVKLTLWSLFFFNLYHLNMKYKNGAFFATEYPMSCLLFDRRFLVKNQIVFDVTLSSGEDIDFTRKIFAQGGKIGISQKNKVQHHFATSFFSFMKKANWYASGILQKEAKNNLYYGYKPTRKAHVLLLPFFYLRQVHNNANRLVKQFYVKDKMLIVPSFLFYFYILLHTTTQPRYFANE